ncbi:MAG: Dyp-type peroxidase [Anaerolineaceae bacterium]|nr:Dyp-type peroxidase [Anaerolineaceae bacterium]
MNEPILAANDIQGNIAPGFSKPHQLFITLKLHQAESGRSLLQALLPGLTSMAEVYDYLQQRKGYLTRGETPPADEQTVWLNVALSAAGLRRFNHPEIEALDPSFAKGMAALSGALGDPHQPDQPGHKRRWLVGGPDNEADLLIIIGADTPARLAEQQAWLTDLIDADPGLTLIHTDFGQRLADDKEHFGFKDGISQPGPRGLVPTDPPEALTTRYLVTQPATGPEFAKPGQPLIWPGQFILGYAPQSSTNYREPLPVPANLPPLARNGSFLVYRRLRQDVAKFRAASRDIAERLQADPDFAHYDQARVEAAFVGRWPSGAPLVRSPKQDDPALGADRFANNHFGFSDPVDDMPLVDNPPVSGLPQGDYWGLACPRFAHIRQVNPRDLSTDQGPAAQTLTCSIIRRGIPFGPAYNPAEPPDSPTNQTERGLIFIAYQASIKDQFEVLHNRWINSEAGPEDAGLDMLVGQNHRPNRPAMFRLRTATATAKAFDVDDINWIIPTGGGYFFTPSLTAVRRLAGEPGAAAAESDPPMQYQKIAPTLLALYEDFRAHQQTGLAKHRSSLTVVAPADSPKPARIVVFITCTDTATFDHLLPHGIEVNQTTGQRRTAILPIDKLDLLANEPAVQRLTPSSRLKPMLDAAVERIHLPQFRSRTGLTGQGVIIGLIDSGIDTAHPAFAGRILRIWDQTLPRSRVAYGRELSPLSASKDDYGHGSHMAGIAAGSDPVYMGLAPEAEFVVVKSDFGGGHIGDAVRYIFDVADELKRPAVVNISLGGHDGPHDGTDDLCLLIDELLHDHGRPRPGRLITCAAGNEGEQAIHARLTLRQNQEQAVRFEVPPSQPAGDQPQAITVALINGWYAGQDEIEISVESPSGSRTAYQPVIRAGNSMQRYDMPDGRITVFTPGPDFVNHDHNFVVMLEPKTANQPLSPGIWRLLLRGRMIQQGLVDIWSVDNNRKLVVSFLDFVDHQVKIGAPGSAASAVTVAGAISKVQWTAIDGQIEEHPGIIGDISPSSSAGPLRTGAAKPDVTAPGEWIISTMAAGSPHPRHLIIDDQHVIQYGTSMSSALMAGIAALLLQRDPNLTYAQFKALLKAQSAIPNRPAGAFDPRWGYGLINMLKL